MLAKIIFFIAVAAASLVVLFLAFLSPSPHNNQQKRNHSLSFSLYIQPLRPLNPHHRQATLHANSAFIFHYKLTSGPKYTSRVIGKAQGFTLLIEQFALAAFNMVYLPFDTPEYYGSLCIEVRRAKYGTKEELIVVGGTGYFSFPQVIASFVPKNRIKLNLRLPRESRKIPG